VRLGGTGDDWQLVTRWLPGANRIHGVNPINWRCWRCQSFVHVLEWERLIKISAKKCEKKMWKIAVFHIMPYIVRQFSHFSPSRSIPFWTAEEAETLQHVHHLDLCGLAWGLRCDDLRRNMGYYLWEIYGNYNEIYINKKNIGMLLDDGILSLIYVIISLMRISLIYGNKWKNIEYHGMLSLRHKWIIFLGII
jgi:hypothetical protein